MNDFRCSVTDVVHTPHPLHLIFSFEPLRDPFLFRQSFDQLKKHGFGLCINRNQMVIQLAAEKQGIVEWPPLYFQVMSPPLPPGANGSGFRQRQIGQEIIAFLVIGAVQFFMTSLQIPPFIQIFCNTPY